MDQNVRKTIQFDATPSTQSTTKPNKKRSSEKKKNIAKVKPQSVKEILLQKLKQYKKEKQMKDKSLVPIQSTISDSFIRSIQKKKNRTEQNISLETFEEPSIITPPPIQPQTTVSFQPLVSKQFESPPPPKYSNLKHSTIPTYRQWKQKTQKQYNHIPIEPSEPSEKSIKLNVSKKMKVGKNKTLKKVGIFLKNKSMKQEIEEKMIEMKKCKVKTMKSYLKKNNLIKYGTSAPTDLLREIYISSQMCGGVQNNNGTNLIQNYYENEDK